LWPGDVILSQVSRNSKWRPFRPLPKAGKGGIIRAEESIWKPY
jgi:hypothetical protein